MEAKAPSKQARWIPVTSTGAFECAETKEDGRHFQQTSTTTTIRLSTFRAVLASSFVQPSSLVTRYSSHCCTTALLSAESPSSSGRLASFARWQATVTKPTRGGPLALCSTGTCRETREDGEMEIRREFSFYLIEMQTAAVPVFAYVALENMFQNRAKIVPLLFCLFVPQSQFKDGCDCPPSPW